MFTFDHLVHYVKDPTEALDSLKTHGIHGVEGGAHLNLGTHNTLSYFDLSYIEFLAVYDQDLFDQSEHLQHSLTASIINDHFAEGFTRFAAKTDDIEAVAQHFKENCLTVTGPIPLKRKRPDGSVLSWQLLFAGSDTEELELPFIIQWDDNDEVRRKDQTERGIIAPHPAGVSFSHVTFAVRDAQLAASKWANLLNISERRNYVDQQLNAACYELELEGGNLIFASPNGEGIVSEVLSTRGERPFKVSLSGGAKEETFELHGATYQITK